MPHVQHNNKGTLRCPCSDSRMVSPEITSVRICYASHAHGVNAPAKNPLALSQ